MVNFYEILPHLDNLNIDDAAHSSVQFSAFSYYSKFRRTIHPDTGQDRPLISQKI